MTRHSLALIVVVPILAIPISAFSTGQQDTTPPESAVPTGFFGTYEPTIELSWRTYTSNPYNSPYSHDDPWTQVLLDELGVAVTFATSSDAPDPAALPDIVALQGSQQLRLHELIAAGRIAHVGDVWNEYASSRLQEVSKSPLFADSSGEEPATFDALRNSDGDLMAIPGPAAGIDSYSYLWIRQDWLDNLGLSPPQTYDEFLAVARAFTYDDPDQNDQDDTYAMLLQSSPSQQMEAFFWSFGSYPDTWLENTTNSGDSLIYGAIQPETLLALEALQTMYHEGLLYQSQTDSSPLSHNSVGIYYGPHWAPYDFAAGWLLDKSIDWNVYPPPASNGGIARGELELDVQRIYAVRAGYPYPESLVKILNTYWEKFYDESSNYRAPNSATYWEHLYDFAANTSSNAGAIPWSNPQATMFPPSLNIAAYREIQEVYDGTREPSELSGIPLQYYNNIEYDPDVGIRWTWQQMFSDPETSPFANIARHIEDGTLFVDRFSTSISAMTDNWRTLSSLQDEAFLTIITGDNDAGQQFSSFVQAWDDSGGNRATEDANRWYNSRE